MIPSRLPPSAKRLAFTRARGLFLAAALIPVLAAAEGAGQPADLIGIYVKALDANPQYQGAVAGFREAAEAKPQALAKLLPQLGAGATAGELEQAVSGQFFKGILNSSVTSGDGLNVNHRDQFYSVGYQVALTQVLFDWGLFKSYDQSELQVGQAGVKVYEALDLLRLQTAQAYFDVLAAQDGVRFASAEKSAVGQLLNQAKNKLSSGLVTDVEAKQAQAEYDLSDAELIDAQNTLDVDLTQLQLLTGGQSYSSLKPLGTNFQPAPPDPNKLDVWLERAQYEEAAARNDAKHGTQVAFLNASAGLSHISALNQAVQSAAAAEDAAQVGYNVGTKTYSDVLLAVRTRYKAERDYAQARYGYIVNFLKLKQSAGALSHADLLTINRWLQQ